MKKKKKTNKLINYIYGTIGDRNLISNGAIYIVIYNAMLDTQWLQLGINVV